VIGDMGEVGDQGPQFHAEIGAWARQRGIDTVLALGELARDSVTAFEQGDGLAGTARHFGDYDALQAAVLAQLPATASVLVKGSRFMKMERVVQAIAAQASTAPDNDNNNKEAGHA